MIILPPNFPNFIGRVFESRSRFESRDSKMMLTTLFDHYLNLLQVIEKLRKPNFGQDLCIHLIFPNTVYSFQQIVTIRENNLIKVEFFICLKKRRLSKVLTEYFGSTDKLIIGKDIQWNLLTEIRKFCQNRQAEKFSGKFQNQKQEV